MKKSILLFISCFMVGIMYTQVFAEENLDKSVVSIVDEDVTGTVYRNDSDDDPKSPWYYLVKFKNNTNKKLMVEYDYQLKADGRWIRRDRFILGPRETRVNLPAGDVGNVQHIKTYETR